jgi:hypothetical protein
MEQIIGMLTSMNASIKSMQEQLTTNGTKLDKMLADRKEMMAWLTDLKNIRKETMACQEKTEARLQGREEPASVDIEPEVADEEVPVEDAARMPVGEPRNTRRDRRNLAADRHQKKQQKRTQSTNGCPKNLVEARRGTTRRAQVAPRRSFSHRRPEIVEHLERIWPSPAEGRPAVRKWHGRNWIKDFMNHRTRKRPLPSGEVDQQPARTQSTEVHRGACSGANTRPKQNTINGRTGRNRRT